MPDISKCTGNGCEIKEQCYRYTVKGSEWQAYTDFWRSLLPGIRCEYFIDKEKRNEYD